LLRGQLLGTSPASLEAAPSSERDSGGVTGIYRVRLVLIGGLADDERGKAVHIPWS